MRLVYLLNMLSSLNKDIIIIRDYHMSTVALPGISAR